ncbi:MAG: toprim domain-containing protein, partial [Firmicutes bacterium]|nr:toprim domain-containing protein [Bacillota bacterium]
IRHCELQLEYGDDFQYHASADLEKSADIIEKVYLKEVQRCGVDNVALLTPYRVKTATGANALNGADIAVRDATYRALLAKLSLASDHQQNLINRGLSPEVIARNGYRTTPLVSGKALSKQLLSEGHTLAGVLGFYMKEGQWSFVPEQRGILIPVRDVQGHIQGLQVRRDDALKRKFRWISSASYTGGCRAEGWTHFVGPPREKIILIEGPLKADVVHHLTGHTVLAVPGVNALTHLEKTLPALRERGVRRIMTAFDMDFLQNTHVQSGYEALTEKLMALGFRYGTYLWNPDYNGLDDYVWEGCLQARV